MTFQVAQRRASGHTDTLVHLFEGPSVTYGGERHAVPRGSRRLLAFVALARGRVERPHVAGALWAFSDENRAAGNLRSALWRLRQAGIDVIVADKWSLALVDDVLVDVHLMGEWASRLIHGTPLPEDLSLPRLSADALDLLPGWCDDWAIIERERLRQRVLHALEALSRHLASVGRYGVAIDAAMAAIASEPLRESAQRVLLEALLTQGNWTEARRIFNDFRTLLRRELDVEPSHELTAMMTTEKGNRLALRSGNSRMAAGPSLIALAAFQ